MHSDVLARLRSRQHLTSPFNAAVASALAIALGAGAPLPALAQTGETGAADAQSSEQRQFNIEGGPLDGVLNRFALEARIDLSVSSELTQGKTSPGLSGQYNVNEALQRLLAGSGLTYRFTGANTVALVAAAREGGGTLRMAPLTVTAQAISTDNIQVINQEDIELRQAKSTKDVFTSEPSITVGGGNSHAQRLYLRGVEQSNLNVTIDGAAAQGGPVHPRHGSAMRIDPTVLKQAEVDTSPSADAGPGALGGAIRFTTVDAQDLLEPGQDYGAKIRLGYATVDEAKTLGATVYTQFLDNVGLFANYTTLNSEDYRMGNGEKLENSADEDKNYLVKLSILNPIGHNFKISAQHNQTEGDKVWRRDGSDIGFGSEDSLIFPMKRERDSVGIEHAYKSTNPLLNTRLRLNQSESAFLWKRDDEFVDFTTNKNSIDLRNTAKFDIMSSASRLTVGVDYNDKESKRSGDPTRYSADNLGFYVQNRAQFQDLSINFGLRHDQYNAEQGVMKLKGDKLSSNISAIYEIVNGFSIFGSYGEAVRATGNVPGFWLLGADENTLYNGKLLKDDPEPFKPETSVRKEYGFNYRGKSIFSESDRLKLKVTAFNTELENVIGADGGNRQGATNIKNLPTLISKGWEARLDYRFTPRLNSALVYSDTKLEDKDGDFYTSGVAKRNGAQSGQRLVWDNKWYVTQDILLGYTLTATADIKNKGELYRKGFAVHDLQASWSPSEFKGLELSLVVNNVLDETYSESTTLGSLEDENIVFEPGRNFRMQASYKF